MPFFDPVAKKYGIFGWYQILPILVPNFTNSGPNLTRHTIKVFVPQALVSWVRFLVPTQTQMIF